MQNAPIGEQLRRRGQHPLGDVGLGADAEQGDACQRVDQLVLVQGAVGRDHIEAAGAQQVFGVGVDVLEQQRTRVCLGHGSLQQWVGGITESKC